MHWLKQWAGIYLSIQAGGCLVFKVPLPVVDQIPYQEKSIFPKIVLYRVSFRHPKKGEKGTQQVQAVDSWHDVKRLCREEGRTQVIRVCA